MGRACRFFVDFLGCAESITADGVKDKESLKAFVHSAKEHLEKDYETAVRDFRTKEEWKKGPIYLYAIAMDRTRFFHVTQPKLEGQKGESPDENKIIDSILEAAQDGDGFTEYKWDNPAVEGEDETLKISYAVIFEKNGEKYALGS